MASSISMSRQSARRQKPSPGSKARTAAATADSIEGLLAEWRRERPDLDPWPFAIFGRAWRLSATLLNSAEKRLAPIGLSFESFSVIVTLRRSGAPFELNPTALYRDSLLSSGAITNRIDRVEAQGLVKRLPDPNDRRGTIVRLTAKGRRLADRAIKLHFETLAELLSGISLDEREQLTALLSRMLGSLETRQEQSGRRR